MSIIAYRDGMLAADTLCTTNGGGRINFAGKLARCSTAAGGATGAMAHVHEFRCWIEAGAPEENGGKFRDKEGFCGLLIKGGRISLWEADGWFYPTLPRGYLAIGSGYIAGLAAMFVNASAEQAVEAAIDCVNTCGGQVQAMDVSDLIQTRPARSVAA